MAGKDYKTFHPKTRSQWRKWLEKNHSTSPGIWLIYFKTETGKRKFSYAEAVEEALCFGWIDSLPRKLDDERAMLKYTPRKPKSIWSKLNKERIEKLIADKLMMQPVLQLLSWQRRMVHGIHSTLPIFIQIIILSHPTLKRL